jgi:1-acyl-sn-glycerol-3-phosphate acyltransferase
VTPKRAVCSLFMAILEIFFREIGVRNQFKVPAQNVPCLFVCAPHHNQFLDPFVVMYATGRLDMCFLFVCEDRRASDCASGCCCVAAAVLTRELAPC